MFLSLCVSAVKPVCALICQVISFSIFEKIKILILLVCAGIKAHTFKRSMSAPNAEDDSGKQMLRNFNNLVKSFCLLSLLIYEYYRPLSI